MPFCSQCGSAVEGRFCPQCGAQQPVPQQATPQPAVPQPAAPATAAGAKRNPLIWVLAGCLGLIAIGAIIAVATGLFVVHKVRQAGFDPVLMKRNPALAATKMLAAVNPDIEVMSVDDGRGIITVREKSTGKTMTMNFEDIRKGKIVFTDENGEQVSLQGQGDGNTGSFSMKTRDKTVTGGTQWSPPGWIPVYSGAKIESGANSHTSEEDSGAGYFTTRDSVDAVMNFYGDTLRKDGFKISTSTQSPGGTNTIGTVSGQRDDGKRSVTIIATPDSGATRIHVTYSLKN